MAFGFRRHLVCRSVLPTCVALMRDRVFVGLANSCGPRRSGIRSVPAGRLLLRGYVCRILARMMAWFPRRVVVELLTQIRSTLQSCAAPLAAANGLRLLGGPYAPPGVRQGDRVTCLYRHCSCVVTGWSAGRIGWLRCRALHHRGGSRLLFTPELVRAVRTESCEALSYWFGVSHATASRWRVWAGVPGHTAKPGSREAHLRHSLAGAAAARARAWTEEERQARWAAAPSRPTRRGPPGLDSGASRAVRHRLGRGSGGPDRAVTRSRPDPAVQARRSSLARWSRP
jgi:hypothetical protein